MLTNPQKNILIRSVQIRLEKGEDIQEIFQSYKNLSQEEKEEILAVFSLSLKEVDIIEAKEAKIQELSAACRAKIEEGVIINMDGKEEHFPYSLSNGDQNNIASLFYISKATGLSQPYHCQGGSCRLYTPGQLAALYIAQAANKAAQETYFNQMKLFIQENFSADQDIDQLKSISYGEPLTGKYLDNYNEILAQNQATIQSMTDL